MISPIEKNNVRVTGRGKRPIMFAHGYGCDQHMWRHVAPAFEDGYQVILFDHVGSGESAPHAYDAQRYSSLHQYAKDVVDICRSVTDQPVIFVGHSVSAMIGILASIKSPETFSSLVLIGPSPCYINSDGYAGGFERKDIEVLLSFLDENHLGWAHAMAPAIMGNEERPHLSNELKESFCRMDPEIAKQFARVTFLSDNRMDLKRVKTPTLIMQCSEDRIAPESVGEYVHQQIAGSELARLRATGHCPNLSAPEETTEVLRAYLSSTLR